ncbi:MAG: hypothetical protein ACI32B_03425 [Erysipelotrichaceae bacterium]
MRKLNITDAFSAYRLIGVLGYRNMLVETTNAYDHFQREVKRRKKRGEKIDEDAMLKQAGVVVIAKIMDAISADKRFEKAFYEFVSGPLEMSVEEIKQLQPVKFFNLLIELAKNEGVDEIKAFFKSLLSLISGQNI